MPKRLVLVVLTAVLLSGCTQRHPSSTTQMSAEDSVIVQKLRLTGKAQREVDMFVRTLPERWVMHENNYWYHMVETTDRSKPEFGSGCTLHLVVSDLRGKLLQDEIRTFTVGNSSQPLYLQSVLMDIHAGEKLEIIVPWYLAYGDEGNDWVPGRENVHVQITYIE